MYRLYLNSDCLILIHYPRPNMFHNLRFEIKKCTVIQIIQFWDEEIFIILRYLTKTRVTWCHITTVIVASQYSSSRDALLVKCYLTSWYRCVQVWQNNSTTIKHIYWVLNWAFYCELNLMIKLTVVTMLLTAIISGISHKQCQSFTKLVACNDFSKIPEYHRYTELYPYRQWH